MESIAKRSDPFLSFSEVVRIDQVCDRFDHAIHEAIRSGGAWPSVEDYLGDTSEPVRSELRKELLAVEASYRQQQAKGDPAGPSENSPATRLWQPAEPAPRQKGNDRNLLFGILALQMDFISRDALVTAMQTWVLSKDKPLGEILVEQKALAANHRTLLEALVQEHLKQHGNDPEKSLAAVSSIASVEEDLKQLGDAEVNATLAIVATVRPAPSLGEQTTAVGGAASAAIRFRILRPHAEGGLGKVSVARDEELSREVALKEIKDHHADNPDIRARFLLEAEITGGLEHPGIVPVYGLGKFADGRPYYAMRFIRGDSLKEAVDRYHDPQVEKTDRGERAVEFRKLLL
ncbi:MAG: hypothetical protein ABSG53_28090, partial [Thermoguttaceae bacterium]